MNNVQRLKTSPTCIAIGLIGSDAFAASAAMMEDAAIKADEAAEAEAAVLEDELDTEKAKEAAKRGEDWFMETRQQGAAARFAFRLGSACGRGALGEE